VAPLSTSTPVPPPSLALVLGKRVGFQKGIHKPHNVPLVMLGAAILWFGWFGFNAGAAAFYAAEGTSDILSGIAGVGSPPASSSEHARRDRGGHPRLGDRREAQGRQADRRRRRLGCRRGSRRHHALLRQPGAGLVAAARHHRRCGLRPRGRAQVASRLDDSLDVVGVHLVGGLIGTLYLGFFATGTGLFLGGNAEQLILQAIAAVTVLVFSFVVAYVLGFIIEKTIGFRVKNEDEIAGIDTVVHGEEGYALVD
jgi:Amt family ammonium transporter